MTERLITEGRGWPLPAAQQPTETETALKLWVTLARAFQAVAAVANRDIARYDLTPAEFGVLECLYHKGPLLLGELRQKQLVSSGGITYLVDRLAARGLVERRDCPSDRRARYAALTADGETLIKRVFPLHAQTMTLALAGLTGVQQIEAENLLKALGLHATRLIGEEESPHVT